MFDPTAAAIAGPDTNGTCPNAANHNNKSVLMLGVQVNAGNYSNKSVLMLGVQARTATAGTVRTVDNPPRMAAVRARLWVTGVT